MNINEFYAGSTVRRDGQDVSYGTGWRSAGDDHRHFDLFWNSGSEELYLMAKPVVNPVVGYVGVALRDDLGEVERLFHPGHARAKSGPGAGGEGAGGEEEPDALAAELEVEILTTIAPQLAVDALLEGWQEAVGEPDGVSWLRARLAERFPI